MTGLINDHVGSIVRATSEKDGGSSSEYLGGTESTKGFDDVGTVEIKL